MTMLEERLRTSGYDTKRAEIYATAARLIHLCKMDMGKAIAAMRAVMNDMKPGSNPGARVHSETNGQNNIGSREISDGEGSQLHMEGLAALGPSSSPQFTNRDDVVQPTREVQAMSARVIPTPNKPRSLADVVEAAKLLKPSRFDTYKLMDGLAIGDISYAEAKRLIPRHKREAALLQLIINHAVPANNYSKVREYIKEDELDRMIQKAAEIQDED